MPRQKRLVIPGVAHHITHRGNNGEPVFFNDEERRRYLSVLRDACEIASTRIIGYCLMTNHIHLVAVPEFEESLAEVMKRTQGEHSRYQNEKYDKKGHVWHGRYFSCPMDLDHTKTALNYVELNPVRAGMVTKPWNFPWSSAPAHCGCHENSLLDLNKWFTHFTATEWRDTLQAEMENKGFAETIRRHTKTGAPLGNPEFFKRAKQRLSG